MQGVFENQRCGGDGSIAEIRYATEKLGALGVKVASNSDGVYLGDDRLDDIFAELNSRGSLVILHPSPARQLPHSARLLLTLGK